MSLRDDLIAAGVAAAVVVGALWYAKKKLGELGTAVNDSVFGEGQDINSVIPLYNHQLPTRPADYDPGDINNGAIF